jgi:hypothetical protein
LWTTNSHVFSMNLVGEIAVHVSGNKWSRGSEEVCRISNGRWCGAVLLSPARSCGLGMIVPRSSHVFEGSYSDLFRTARFCSLLFLALFFRRIPNVLLHGDGRDTTG